MGETMKPRNSETSPCAYPVGGDDWQARAGAETCGVQKWSLRARLDNLERLRLQRVMSPETASWMPGFWWLDFDDGDSVIEHVERHLEIERKLGRQGRWCYCLSRHLALGDWAKRLRSMRNVKAA